MPNFVMGLVILSSLTAALAWDKITSSISRSNGLLVYLFSFILISIHYFMYVEDKVSLNSIFQEMIFFYFAPAFFVLSCVFYPKTSNYSEREAIELDVKVPWWVSPRVLFSRIKIVSGTALLAVGVSFSEHVSLCSVGFVLLVFSEYHLKEAEYMFVRSKIKDLGLYEWSTEKNFQNYVDNSKWRVWRKGNKILAKRIR